MHFWYKYQCPTLSLFPPFLQYRRGGPCYSTNRLAHLQIAWFFVFCVALITPQLHGYVHGYILRYLPTYLPTTYLSAYF